MAALWGWKHPTHRTQTDQAGKTTTQSARCYVFCDCTHIRIECIDGVDGASLGTKTIRKLNLCGDGLGAHTSRSRESAGPQHCGGI